VSSLVQNFLAKGPYTALLWPGGEGSCGVDPFGTSIMSRTNRYDRLITHYPQIVRYATGPTAVPSAPIRCASPGTLGPATGPDPPISRGSPFRRTRRLISHCRPGRRDGGPESFDFFLVAYTHTTKNTRRVRPVDQRELAPYPCSRSADTAGFSATKRIVPQEQHER